MKPSKNLRDRLANQAGMPTGGSGTPHAHDAGLLHQINLAKAKQKSGTADGGAKGDAPRSITAGKPPSEQRHGPKGGPAAGRGTSKSTTQQGLH